MTLNNQNYRVMWYKLKENLGRLQGENITLLHQAIVLGYMDFLEQEFEARGNQIVVNPVGSVE